MKLYLPVLLLALFSRAGFSQQNIASFREITATQALGDRIFFTATHDQYGSELFVSSADSRTVTLLKDIATGYQGSGPTQLTVFRNQIFFIAYTREFGASVWTTDGTLQGTQLVYGVKNAEPFNLMVFKDKLYFTTNLGTIMRTDGTAAGTEIYYQSPANYGRIQTVIRDNQYIYFSYDNRTIFRDDGSARISFLGPLSWEDVYFRNFFSLGSKLVVIKAGSSDHIIRIYAIDNSVVHDGGEDEWTLIKKLDAPNVYGSQYLANFTIVGNRLLFNYRKSYENTTPADELWTCDGTDEGTKMVKVFNWLPYSSNSNISRFFVFKEKLFFQAGESDSKALWSSDGTVEGTFKIHDAIIEAPHNDERMPVLVTDDKFYFGGGARDNAELWESDGTTAGTKLLMDLEDGGSSWPHDLSYSNGVVYFLTSKSYSSTLWSTTPAPDISLWGYYNNSIYSGAKPLLFYNVARGTCETAGLKILNKGLSDLYLSNIYVTGRDFYLVKRTLPEKLAPGESVTFEIVFNPVVDGKSAATLSVLSNDPDEPQYTVELEANVLSTATGKLCDFSQAQYVKTLESGKVSSSITLSNSTIAEGQPNGTVIGDLFFAAGATFELVAGEGDADNSYFKIEGNQLKTAAEFDYNVRSLYTIRVKAITAGESSESSLRINVRNISRGFIATDCQPRFQLMGYAITALESNAAGHLFATNGLGQVLRSVNSGESWDIVYTGDYSSLNTIFFKGNTGYIVGIGALLKSEDAGATWFRIYVPIKYNYYYNTGPAHFLNENEGYLGTGNGELFFTADGGRSWETRLQDDYTKFSRLHFLTKEKGYAIVNYGNLIQTTDGGRTWSDVDLSGLGSNIQVGNIYFTSDKIGFLITNYYVYKTTNGGQSWTQVQDIPGGTYLGGVRFQNASVGYLYGAENVLFKTLDGGDTWQPIYTTGAPGRHIGVAISSGKTFVISRSSYSNYDNARAISMSSDEGATWSTICHYPGATTYRIQFYGTATGLILTTDGLFHTKDNGISWSQSATDLTNIFDVYLIDENTVLFNSNGSIYKSTDGGVTSKVVLQTGAEPNVPQAGRFYASPGNTLFSINYSGTYRSEDSGESWQLMSNMEESFVQGIHFISSTVGYRVELFGSVEKSVDGGKNWSDIFTRDPTASSPFNAIFFLNEDEGYKGGNSLQRTTDGGLTWQTVDWEFYEIMAIHFENVSHGYVATRTGMVYETTDGGVIWKEVLYTSSRISDAQFREGEVYVAGENGFSARLNTKPGTPSMPGYIYGPDRICIGDAVDFRLAVDNGYSTVWTTTGGNIDDRRDYFTVKFSDPGEYTLTAKYVNTCGTSDVRSRKVNVSGPAALVIEGSDAVAQGEEDVQYEVSNAPANASYLWSVEGGTTATPNGEHVSVNWNLEATSGKVSVLEVDASGCRAYGSMVVSLGPPLAVEEYLDSHINIYPNPADGDIQLSSSHSGELIVRIIDVRGYEYARHTLNAGDVQQLQTRNLAAGLYLIEITDGEQTITKKLIRK